MASQSGLFLFFFDYVGNHFFDIFKGYRLKFRFIVDVNHIDFY